MQVTKLGDGLVVRLSAEEVERLGLQEGDEVEVSAAAPKLDLAEAFKEIRKYRGRLPADFKFDREEAHRRD